MHQSRRTSSTSSVYLFFLTSCLYFFTAPDSPSFLNDLVYLEGLVFAPLSLAAGLYADRPSSFTVLSVCVSSWSRQTYHHLRHPSHNTLRLRPLTSLPISSWGLSRLSLHRVAIAIFIRRHKFCVPSLSQSLRTLTRRSQFLLNRFNIFQPLKFSHRIQRLHSSHPIQTRDRFHRFSITTVSPISNNSPETYTRECHSVCVDVVWRSVLFQTHTLANIVE